MDKPEFVTAEVYPGKLNSLVKNIMKQTGVDDPNEAVRLVNSGEWIVSRATRKWREENSVIYFSVTSDGTIGANWIPRLEKNGFKLSKGAKSVLLSSYFKPSEPGTTTEIAVLKGELFSDNDRITKKIRTEAYAGTFTQARKLCDPNPEVACLIRENFSDKELEAMGLYWIVAMHDPINDSVGDPGLLSADRGDGGRWLDTYYDRSDLRWSRDGGFAFAVAQVGPKN
jgi:hypothetical protein